MTESNFANFDVRRPDALRLDGNIAENWRVFKQNFDIFAIAIGLDERSDQQKAAIFLNACGPETVEIFNTLGLSEEQKKSYTAVLTAISKYCTPQKNEVYEAFKFNSRKQEEDESFETYLLDLQKLVKSCGYKDPDRMVRDNIVIGINNHKLRKKFLETNNLNLQKTIEIARASELVERHANDMQKQIENTTTVDAVNSRANIHLKFPKKTNNNPTTNGSFHSTTNSNSGQKKNCKFCKGTHLNRRCPAFGKRCNNCGRFNHFSIACFATKVREIKEYTNSVTEDDDVYLHNISECGVERKRWYEKIRVNECIIKFKLDTGADVNVLPYRFLKYMKNVTLKSSGLPPQNYGGTDLNYIGTADCVVMCRNELIVLKFTVIETPYEPLLGLEACEKLKLIKRIDIVSKSSKEYFIEKNRDIFEGLGCFVKNLDIKVKQNSVPVVKAARRVPLSLNDRVKPELQRMVDRDIIERVDVSIERASNLVIVEKKTGQLRLCIDPQDVNADILLENHIIPSFESISAKLANKRFFTVLDLKEGFWQIGLSKKASELCTFNTPFGCYPKGENIWYNHNRKGWVKAKVLEYHGDPRSYWIELEDGSIFRRNTRWLRKQL